MTENLLQKLEEKMSAVLTELDTLRRELNQLRQENSSLKSEKANYTEKLQGLISLLDALEMPHESLQTNGMEVFPGRSEYVNA